VRPLNFNTWNSLNETVAFDPSANYPDKTFGYASGSVDAAKVVAGGVGGNWGGSMPRALWFARVADDWAKANGKTGSLVTSQKRSRQKTDSGNTSDHYEGNSMRAIRMHMQSISQLLVLKETRYLRILCKSLDTQNIKEVHGLT
jgi:hypothetical protein